MAELLVSQRWGSNTFICYSCTHVHWFEWFEICLVLRSTVWHRYAASTFALVVSVTWERVRPIWNLLPKLFSATSRWHLKLHLIFYLNLQCSCSPSGWSRLWRWPRPDWRSTNRKLSYLVCVQHKYRWRHVVSGFHRRKLPKFSFHQDEVSWEQGAAALSVFLNLPQQTCQQTCQQTGQCKSSDFNRSENSSSKSESRFQWIFKFEWE